MYGLNKVTLQRFPYLSSNGYHCHFEITNCLHYYGVQYVNFLLAIVTVSYTKVLL